MEIDSHASSQPSAGVNANANGLVQVEDKSERSSGTASASSVAVAAREKAEKSDDADSEQSEQSDNNEQDSAKPRNQKARRRNPGHKRRAITIAEPESDASETPQPQPVQQQKQRTQRITPIKSRSASTSPQKPQKISPTARKQAVVARRNSNSNRSNNNLARKSASNSADADLEAAWAELKLAAELSETSVNTPTSSDPEILSEEDPPEKWQLEVTAGRSRFLHEIKNHLTDCPIFGRLRHDARPQFSHSIARCQATRTVHCHAAE